MEAQAIANAKSLEVLNKSVEKNRPWGVEQVGVWVWITNTERQDASDLKELGFKWSPKKKSWYWANQLKMGRRVYAKNLDTLRDMHGTNKLK